MTTWTHTQFITNRLTRSCICLETTYDGTYGTAMIDLPYRVYCADHGVYRPGIKFKRDAERIMRRPWEWCDKCKKIYEAKHE